MAGLNNKMRAKEQVKFEGYSIGRGYASELASKAVMSE